MNMETIVLRILDLADLCSLKIIDSASMRTGTLDIMQNQFAVGITFAVNGTSIRRSPVITWIGFSDGSLVLTENLIAFEALLPMQNKLSRSWLRRCGRL